MAINKTKQILQKRDTVVVHYFRVLCRSGCETKTRLERLCRTKHDRVLKVDRETRAEKTKILLQKIARPLERNASVVPRTNEIHHHCLTSLEGPTPPIGGENSLQSISSSQGAGSPAWLGAKVKG